MWPGVTGVTSSTGVWETIDLALHFHPNTNTVAVIIGSSTPDRYFLGQIHAELLRHQSIREIDLVGLPANQLMERVAELPPQTVVLFQLAPQKSVQPTVGVTDILAWVAQRLPAYSIFPVDILNRGGIGGVGIDWGPELSLVAEQARRVLSQVSDRRTFRLRTTLVFMPWWTGDSLSDGRFRSRRCPRAVRCYTASRHFGSGIESTSLPPSC